MRIFFELMFYVYVLISLKDKKFYIGFTNDLKRRLKEHNSGKNISTKSRLPLKLILVALRFRLEILVSDSMCLSDQPLSFRGT